MYNRIASKDSECESIIKAIEGWNCHACGINLQLPRTEEYMAASPTTSLQNAIFKTVITLPWAWEL